MSSAVASRTAVNSPASGTSGIRTSSPYFLGRVHPHNRQQPCQLTNTSRGSDSTPPSASVRKCHQSFLSRLDLEATATILAMHLASRTGRRLLQVAVVLALVAASGCGHPSFETIIVNPCDHPVEVVFWQQGDTYDPAVNVADTRTAPAHGDVGFADIVIRGEDAYMSAPALGWEAVWEQPTAREVQRFTIDPDLCSS